MKTFKTKEGTELPLLDLRGKDYLEVRYRLVWFREEHPDWAIETEFVGITTTSCLAKATIKDSAGRIVATGHKAEDQKGFFDFLEKSETGAIGRALALVGYGTQFCADELDEGQRIVDAPGPAVKKNPPPVLPKNTPASDAQRKLIFATSKDLGLDEPALKEFFFMVTEKSTSKEWSMTDIDKLLKAIADFKKGKPVDTTPDFDDIKY